MALSETLLRLRGKIEGGGRIAADEGEWLLSEAPFHDLIALADGVRSRLHPQGRVGFVVDRNVNYTNICTTGCRFCAFYREQSAPDAYLLSHEAILAKVAELDAVGGTQLLLQGGLHPDLTIEWFEELFGKIDDAYPGVRIHSLSPAEVVHLAERSELTVRGCLARLKGAGLKSLPGGGAEILDDVVRRTISPRKIGWEAWMEVMEAAHHLEMPTTATMMFGTVEQPGQIIEHLVRIRNLQDLTGGFTAFIPWTYQPGNTELGGTTASGVEYLRVLAVSRMLLDNVANLQASWVTQGAHLAQMSLRCGANDMGGTMLEENVVAAAGVSFRISREEIIDLIRGAGFQPVRRTTDYTILEEY